MVLALNYFLIYGLAIAAALFIVWYFFGREAKNIPPSEKDWEEISESLHESSTEFDLPDFPEFLRRLAPLIQKALASAR
jgi:MFS superfamily sulfate permease-like transporter